METILVIIIYNIVIISIHLLLLSILGFDAFLIAFVIGLLPFIFANIFDLYAIIVEGV